MNETVATTTKLINKKPPVLFQGAVISKTKQKPTVPGPQSSGLQQEAAMRRDTTRPNGPPR